MVKTTDYMRRNADAAFRVGTGPRARGLAPKLIEGERALRMSPTYRPPRLGGAIAGLTLVPIVKGTTGNATPYLPAGGWVSVIGGTILLGMADTLLSGPAPAADPSHRGHRTS